MKNILIGRISVTTDYSIIGGKIAKFVRFFSIFPQKKLIFIYVKPNMDFEFIAKSQ